MKRFIIKYWYVSIVFVVLLMLTLIVLITNQSAYQRITLWLLFVALISLPVSWIWLFIFKERRKALLSILWSIASICILLIPLSIAIISDPHVPNSLSDEKNQPPKSEAMQAVRENRTFHTIRKGGTIKEVSEVDDITLVGTSDGICGMEEYVSDMLWVLLSNDSTHIVLNKLSSAVSTQLYKKWLE